MNVNDKIQIMRLKEIKDKLEKDGSFRIAFVGDSLTSCEWVHPNWREIVEYVLKEELQRQFSDWKVPSWGIRGYNLGFDGSTTRDIKNKLKDIVELRPDLVLGLMGGNDPVLGVEVKETGKNLREIFETLEKSGAKIIWSTALPDLRGEKIQKYDAYRKVTIKVGGGWVFDGFEKYRNYDLERFFTFKSEENPEEGIKKGERDPCHPNQLGNAYVAKMFLEEMGISFDAEKYTDENRQGEKFPGY